MKPLKTTFFTLIFFFFTVLVVLAVTKKLMSVQVREGEVRAAPSFLSRVIDTLSYGEQVKTSEEQGLWVKVSLTENGLEGWVHGSALTTKRIKLRSGSGDVGTEASTDEIALAGKGFNETIEKEYRAKHQDLNYACVDWMEKIVVSPEQMEEFLKAGDLSPEGGAE